MAACTMRLSRRSFLGSVLGAAVAVVAAVYAPAALVSGDEYWKSKVLEPLTKEQCEAVFVRHFDLICAAPRTGFHLTGLCDPPVEETTRLEV